MSTTSNTSGNLPRLTSQFGKYAKKSTTTTYVHSGNTTIITNGKTKINIFNNKGCCGEEPVNRCKGNVYYNGKNYKVPVHQWATPYNMGGGSGSIWGNGYPSYSVTYERPELSGWDKFMQFMNVVGPGNVAALAGGTMAGIGGAISSWLNNDDKNTTTTQQGTTQNTNAGYQTISGHDNIGEVTNYNDAVGQISTKQNAVSTANVDYLNAKQAAAEAALPLQTAKANIENYDSQLTGLKSSMESAKTAYEQAKGQNPQPSNLSELETAYNNANKAYTEMQEKREQEANKISGLQTTLSTAINTMNDKKTAYDNLNNEYKTFLSGVGTKKEAALQAIRNQNGTNGTQASTTTTDYSSLLKYTPTKLDTTT